MLFLNDSYNDSEVRRKLAVHCGKPLGFWHNLKNGGNGIGGLKLTKAPPECDILFKTSDSLFTSIEFRKLGLIVRVKFKTETYAIAVRYQDLRSVELSRVAFGKSQLALNAKWGSLIMSYSTSLENEVKRMLLKHPSIPRLLKDII